MNWYPSPDFLAQAGHALLAACAVFAPIALSNHLLPGLWGTIAVLTYAALKEFTFDLWVEGDSVSNGWRDMMFFGVGSAAAWLTIGIKLLLVG